MAESLPEPLGPEHARSYPVVDGGVTDWLPPLTLLEPLHPPEAVQEVAPPLTAHIKFEESPWLIVGGEAEKSTLTPEQG